MFLCVTFVMSSIDFNVTIKRINWGVSEGIYYNPYYHAERRIRPLADKMKDRFKPKGTLFSILINEIWNWELGIGFK